MDILITGETGVGKTVLAELLRNEIFKHDKDSRIVIIDYNGDRKEFGQGTKNIYFIKTEQISNKKEEEFDIVIKINNKTFIELLDSIK